VRPAVSLDFTALGLWIRYDSGEPGVDRVAACAEAFARTGGPLIVIGLGTAVHTNVVTADGTYRGGAIMPGLRLMSESLGVGTDQVGVIVPESPSRVIGTSTPECVEIGLFHGWLGGTLRLIDETQRELKEIDPTGKTPALWISGGHAEWIAPELPDAHVDADLSVLGLARLWNALH
jgi:type III pantothenate kinase